MASPMRTVSFKLPEALDDALADLAQRRNVSRSAIVRESLAALAADTHRSVTALADSLVGSLGGPPDLSTSPAHMTGYGK